VGQAQKGGCLMAEEFEPIHIVELVISEVGSPENNGTKSGTLYSIPFKLSREAPAEWADLFVQAWDHPSFFTTMFRPGIAKVSRDRIILDGTSMDDVEKYHKTSLILTVEHANLAYAELLKKQQEEDERQREAELKHRKVVGDTAKRIKF
jgi:hypothetical protein